MSAEDDRREAIERAARTLISINPGAPWFVVTRGIQQIISDLAGRRGKREINTVIGVLVARREIRQDGSCLYLTTIKDGDR